MTSIFILSSVDIVLNKCNIGGLDDPVVYIMNNQSHPDQCLSSKIINTCVMFTKPKYLVDYFNYKMYIGKSVQ